IEAHRLLSAGDAIRGIHFPVSFDELEQARRRLVFEEFFMLQLLLALRRRSTRKATSSIRFDFDPDRLQSELDRLLPFPLTSAQQRAIREIANDLQSGRAMNRLLQGDVGSGKTVVALAAALIAVANGFQVALMAPTEILAQQHTNVLRRLLE